MNYEKYDLEDFVCDHSFQQYCRGEDSASVSFWEDWRNNNPEKQDIIDAARELVSILNAGQVKRNDQLFQLQKGLQQRELLERTLKVERPYIFPLKKAVKYISGIAASVIIATGVYFSLKQQGGKHGLSAGLREESFRNDGSGRKTVVLPDGTLVTLNRNSVMQLAAGFGRKAREVSLQGEGYFEVKQDPARPFVVKTNTLRVRVLGTVFNLKAYPSDKGITETSLLKGKIEVGLNNHLEKKYILTPHQKLTTTEKASGSTASPENLPVRITRLSVGGKQQQPQETNWVRNHLEISNESLGSIAQKLEKWYGIRIMLEDENVKNYRYSGTFESETVLEALEALQLSYHFNFRAENEKIIITK